MKNATQLSRATGLRDTGGRTTLECLIVPAYRQSSSSLTTYHTCPSANIWLHGLRRGRGRPLLKILRLPRRQEGNANYCGVPNKFVSMKGCNLHRRLAATQIGGDLTPKLSANKKRALSGATKRPGVRVFFVHLGQMRFRMSRPGERRHSGRLCRRRECRCILPDELLHAQRLLPR